MLRAIKVAVLVTWLASVASVSHQPRFATGHDSGNMSSYTDIATVAIHFDAESGTFGDWGATTPASTNGAAVLRWSSSVGGKYAIDTSGQGDTKLRIEDGRRYIDFGGKASGLGGQGNWSGLLGNSVTFGTLLRTRREDIDGAWDSASGTANAFRAYGGRFDWFANDPATTQRVLTPGKDQAIVVRMTLNPGRTEEVWVDGVKIIDESSATTTGSAWTQTQPPWLGAVGGGLIGRFDGLIRDAVWYDAALSDGSVALLTAALQSRAGSYTAPPVATQRVIVLGNSFAAGAFLPWPAKQNYAAQMAAAHPEWEVMTNGHPGETTTQLAARVATEVTPNVLNRRTVVVVQEIINDLYFGATAAQALSNLRDICDDIKAASPSVRIVVCGPTPRSGAGTPGDYETQRQGVITVLDSGVDIGVHWDAVAAWHQVDQMGGAGDENNLANYFDKIHPIGPGHRRLYPSLAEQIEAVMPRGRIRWVGNWPGAMSGNSPFNLGPFIL